MSEITCHPSGTARSISGKGPWQSVSSCRGRFELVFLGYPEEGVILSQDKASGTRFTPPQKHPKWERIKKQQFGGHLVSGPPGQGSLGLRWPRPLPSEGCLAPAQGEGTGGAPRHCWEEGSCRKPGEVKATGRSLKEESCQTSTALVGNGDP